MAWHTNYKTAHHSRVNDGTSSDLSQVLATHPGWLTGVQVFNLSSAAPQHLFIYDTTATVTTTTVPVWQAVIPYNIFVEGTTRGAVGAGVVFDMAGGLSLDNGLAYAVSSNANSTALSTVPIGTIKVNLEYITSSCL